MAAYFVSPGDKALASAARLYIYGTGHISKETFDDPEFHSMNQAYYVAGGGRGKAPVLTTKGLKAWVDAEYDVFKIFSSFIAKRLLEYSMGNPPEQGIHDCATLGNKGKFMSSGFQFISSDLGRNLAVLRVNREFMKYMRQDHPEASQQHFNMAVLKSGDNVEGGSEEEEEERSAAGG